MIMDTHTQTKQKAKKRRFDELPEKQKRKARERDSSYIIIIKKIKTTHIPKAHNKTFSKKIFFVFSFDQII